MASRYPVYQLDFSAVASGKRVATTKRRIRWRFGFPNQKALSDGLTGTDCRGEEHDVTIVWSITSGKRQITMDGREIHYSTNRASLLDFSWQTKGNHVIKVICHAAPPLTAEPGFRQYDLWVDGQSFFTMPKVFQLGVKGQVPNHIPGGYGHPISPVSMGSSSLSREMPTSREQEEEDLRRAIQASIQESRAHLEARSMDDRSAYTTPHPAPAPQSADLLDLDGPSPPTDAASVASMPSYYSAPPTYGQTYQSPPPQHGGPSPSAASSGALVPAVPPPGYYQGAPPQTAPPAYASPPPASYSSPGPPSYASPPPNGGGPPLSYSSPPPVPPAPAPTPAAPYGAPPNMMNGTPMQNGDIFGLNSNAQDDPFAPKPPPPPTHQDLASAILASYQSPGGPPGTPAPNQNGFPNTPDSTTTPVSNDASATPSMSMNTLAITAVEEEPKSEFEKALKNLVNVDHIDEPAEGEVKLTMIKKEEARKLPKGKSVPKPPVGKGMVGENAPLSQIKQNFESPPKQTSEGIMNAPPPGAFNPNAAYAGALVVHGQGPPPLHQAQGFGVGRYLPGGGFQGQQQLAPGHYMQQQQATPQYR
eukprot:CAMPEP_0178825718 /NCGR_PEP_ID=MMETSP0746-20121128/6373_1 /TAXON_ID=913974 /ORGANISM="Nitzschia punctata, Strain CCMP561" /LENGTH=588 /DNA_ID=CAMNT_0020487505 /DNA_START=272 /DNA_END=2038 /DNA_ORIENTATION=-